MSLRLFYGKPRPRTWTQNCRQAFLFFRSVLLTRTTDWFSIRWFISCITILFSATNVAWLRRCSHIFLWFFPTLCQHWTETLSGDIKYDHLAISWMLCENLQTSWCPDCSVFRNGGSQETDFFSFFKFGSVPLNLPLHSGLRRKNVKKHLASVLMTQDCARIYLSSLMFIFVKNIWVCVTW